MAGSPAGARVAGGSKIPVPDRCEGDSHRRSRGVEVVRLPGAISGEKAPLGELHVEVGALRVTRATLSVPGRLGGTGCISGYSSSCFPAFIKVCWAVNFM